MGIIRQKSKQLSRMDEWYSLRSSPYAKAVFMNFVERNHEKAGRMLETCKTLPLVEGLKYFFEKK